MPDKEYPERCLECEKEITERILTDEDFFLNISAYRQVNLTTHGIRIGSAVYCLHCWTFQPKVTEQKPLQREVSADILRTQWGELNQRSRWYTQQTWQGPFAFVTVASIAAYNLVRGNDMSVAAKAIGFALLTILGIATVQFLIYIGQGIDSSIRQMMRIELYPQFLRTSALEGARDPGGFLQPSWFKLRKHRALVMGVVWFYTLFLALLTTWFSWQSL
jgi:hypothetical protein